MKRCGVGAANGETERCVLRHFLGCTYACTSLRCDYAYLYFCLSKSCPDPLAYGVLIHALTGCPTSQRIVIKPDKYLKSYLKLKKNTNINKN